MILKHAVFKGLKNSLSPLLKNFFTIFKGTDDGVRIYKTPNFFEQEEEDFALNMNKYINFKKSADVTALNVNFLEVMFVGRGKAVRIAAKNLVYCRAVGIPVMNKISMQVIGNLVFHYEGGVSQKYVKTTKTPDKNAYYNDNILNKIENTFLHAELSGVLNINEIYLNFKKAAGILGPVNIIEEEMYNADLALNDFLFRISEKYGGNPCEFNILEMDSQIKRLGKALISIRRDGVFNISAEAEIEGVIYQKRFNVIDVTYLLEPLSASYRKDCEKAEVKEKLSFAGNTLCAGMQGK